MSKVNRKSRFGFNVEKDIELLKLAVTYNPWQLGEENWTLISEELSEKFGTVTRRTTKTRIDLLLKKYEAQQLQSRTGTEEEVSERGCLLETIAAFVAEANASINNVAGAEDSEAEEHEELIPAFTEIELAEATTPKPTRIPKIKNAERVLADKERDRILKASTNTAPEANGHRRKRQKMCPEDEMINRKQEHDMQMDVERLNLEKDKLELEKQREVRMLEESKRRDALAASQLETQNTMLAMMIKLVEKS